MTLPLFLFAAVLFNGKTLDGWVHEGPRPSFFVENGTLATSGRGHVGNWLRTEREYENFRLRFDYKLAQWAEAAVLLRAPRSERPYGGGLALVLAHDFHHEVTPWVTGAIAGVTPPLKPVAGDFEKWHSVAIDLNGRSLTAAIDGVTVQDLELDSQPGLAAKLRRGYIGFPDMGYRYAVRNIEIELLAETTRFAPPPKSWELRGGGNWRITDDVVEASNGHGINYADWKLADFELTAIVRSHRRVNSGIFLRGRPEENYRGFEVQIYSPVDAVYPTGSVYALQRSRVQADLEERWFLMQIRVEGARCRVWLDGDLVADYDKLTEAARKPGRVGLQIHMEDTSVEFRDLRVRPL